MKIVVIIPVVQPKLANELLLSIKQNIILPDVIFAIDNVQASPHFQSHIPELPLIQIPTSDEFIGTNEAWKLGLDRLPTDADIICIFNDDIVLNPYFFAKLIGLLKASGKFCACAIPTVVPYAQLKNTSLSQNRFRQAQKRNGFAMCFKKDLFMKFPPIPPTMKIFYGDDWYYSCSKALDLHWIRMLDNPVFHHKGATVHQYPDKQMRTQRKNEWRIFLKEWRKWRLHQLTKQT